MIFRSIVLVALTFVFTFFMAPVASAHASEPRLEISVERLSPGGVVDVRGVAFDYEELVTLALIGTQSEIMLGEIAAGLEGEFTHVVVLPSDLAEGTYYFRATTSHHWLLSPALMVSGTAQVEGGGQGLRDEDDGLLAPMPTFAPGVVPGGVPQATPLPEPQRASPSNRTSTMFVTLGLLVMGILVSLGLRTMRKK